MVHQSVATIDAPEFLNLQPSDISPLMAKCEIKVFYLGENRNGSFISKEVATEMGKTLRGAPIVGYYKEEAQDFRDHGQVVIIDDEGVHFNVATMPYGFVSPTAEVWFKDFEESDDFGNKIVRTYLMTTGYLWTEQFPELKSVIEDSKGQSMELNEEKLEGHWAENLNTGREFFIINSAIVSKLCILGDDVEPCFEGSSISAPDISKNFSYEHDAAFKRTLYSMMKELQKTLQGGKAVENEVIKAVEVDGEVAEVKAAEEFSTESQVETVEGTDTEFDNSTEEVSEAADATSEESQSNFEKKDEEDDKSEDSEDKGEKEDSKPADEEDEKKKEDEDKYALLQSEYAELQSKYDAMSVELENAKAQVSELLEFKSQVDLKDKQALIDSFSMLTDEDKSDVVEHINEYSLSDIKSKLAVVCFDKKIGFEKETVETEALSTVKVDTHYSTKPEWLQLVDSRIEEQK